MTIHRLIVNSDCKCNSYRQEYPTVKSDFGDLIYGAKDADIEQQQTLTKKTSQCFFALYYFQLFIRLL